MIVSRRNKPERKIEIDLAGPEGNAFALLGIASNLYKQITRNDEFPFTDKEGNRKSHDDIQNEMKASDYDNLVATLDKYFGDFIIIYEVGSEDDDWWDEEE